MKPEKKKKFTPPHLLDQRLIVLAGKIQAVNGSLPVNHRGSPQRTAWTAWRKTHGLPHSFFARAEVATVITEYPPVNLAALTELESSYEGRGGGITSRTTKALTDGR